MFSKRLFRLILVAGFLALTACNEPATPSREGATTAQNTAQKPPSLNLDYNGNPPGHRLYKKPEWPLEIRKEVYGDPEIFSTPRVQFTATFEGDIRFEKTERRSLWSMRLDGSDVRLVADEELLDYKGGGIAHKPIRSPNNRYVALSLSDRDYNYVTAILDLKTQEKWIIGDGGGPPDFNWTSDSDTLYFYSNRKHYKYQIPSKSLTKGPAISGGDLFLLPSDDRFLLFYGNGYRIYTLDGNVEHDIQYEFEVPIGAQAPMVSPNGDRFFFMVGNTGYWIDLNRTETIKTINMNLHGILSSKLLFGKDGNFFYIYSCCSITKFDVESMKKIMDKVKLKEVGIWSIHRPEAHSIFNRGANK